MSMLAISMTVLLMRMRTRDKMGDAHTLEKGFKFLVLTSPVSLHCKIFLIKESLNMMLKVTEFLKHIIFLFQEIDPSELVIIINKTHILFKKTKGF
jgi:hypothetical protein